MVTVRTLSLYILLKFVLLSRLSEHEGIPVTQVRPSTSTSERLVSHVSHLVANDVHLLLHHHVFIELICDVALLFSFFILRLRLYDTRVLQSNRRRWHVIPLTEGDRCVAGDPWMVDEQLSLWSYFWVKDKTLGDKV